MTNQDPRLPKFTLDDFIKSMEGGVVKYGEPKELIWRLATTIDTELNELYQRIEDLRGELGL